MNKSFLKKHPTNFLFLMDESLIYLYSRGVLRKINKSTYDFSVTLGQRGTNSNNLLKENYIKFGLSMSFEGIWFVKQKYN